MSVPARWVATLRIVRNKKEDEYDVFIEVIIFRVLLQSVIAFLASGHRRRR